VTASGRFWLNGQPTEALPVPDRALEFGDGLFETLLLRHSEPVYLELHLQRLQAGLETLRFPPCIDAARRHILAACAETTPDAHNPWQALRITVSRGAGPRGYTPPVSAQPRFLVALHALERDALLQLPAASLGITQMQWSEQPLLAGIKHLNRLEQVLACDELSRLGVDEALMLGQSGQVVSVTAGNLFAVSGGKLVTPVLDVCGIRGTRRQSIIERWAPALGIPVIETRLTVADIHSADEVFFCNSLIGLRPVDSFQSREWQRHPVCGALHAQYRQELAA
tara:strand:+ start:31958 stop:32803 length:846 start_codon:yes stop_codon:yes gene_type:complete